MGRGPGRDYHPGMLIPLGTDRPLRRPTVVNHVLIALNVVVALAMIALERADPGAAEGLVRRLWLARGDLTPWGFVTYAFLHGGALHLLGNMVTLWVFGANVEDKLGRVGYLGLYLGGAAIAGSAHIAFEPAAVIGASGAVAAVTGAYLVLFPRTMIRCLVVFFVIGLFWIRAWWFIAFAVAKDLFWLAGATQIVGSDGVQVADGVARMAHIGGYAFGAAVSVALLWGKVLAREPFDLFTIARQAGRRRAIREATLEAERKVQRKMSPRRAEDEARAEAMAAARAGVASMLSRGDLAGAAEGYRRLLSEYGDLPGAATLSRQHLYDLANHLFQARDYQLAIEAYDRFLEAYPRDSHAPSVRLMVALINARYLNDPIRAKQILAGLDSKLDDDREKELARELVAELA